MADKKDYPNRRVLSLEEVEAVVGGAIGIRKHPKDSLFVIEGTSDVPIGWVCPKCNRYIRTKEEFEIHWSMCGRNTTPNNNK